MKFAIDYGHNCPPDTGCPGVKLEDNLTKLVGQKVIAKLKALNYAVVDTHPGSAATITESLAKRCKSANDAQVDRYVSIHFNCFDGTAHGTEVFAISEAGRAMATPVLTEICQLGFFNRGVKDGSHLYVLRNTSMPAILIECCFCDSVRNMKVFDSELMANALVKGLTGKTA